MFKNNIHTHTHAARVKHECIYSVQFCVDECSRNNVAVRIICTDMDAHIHAFICAECALMVFARILSVAVKLCMYALPSSLIHRHTHTHTKRERERENECKHQIYSQLFFFFFCVVLFFKFHFHSIRRTPSVYDAIHYCLIEHAGKIRDHTKNEREVEKRELNT